MSITIPKWRGARAEPLRIAIKGDVAPWVWPRGWFYMLVLNPIIKPDRPLSEVLYGTDRPRATKSKQSR